MAFVEYPGLEGTSNWNITPGPVGIGYIVVPASQGQQVASILAADNHTAFLIKRADFGIVTAVKTIAAFDLGDGTWAVQGDRTVYGPVGGNFNSGTTYEYFLPLQEIQALINAGGGGGGVQSITGEGALTSVSDGEGNYTLSVTEPSFASTSSIEVVGNLESGYEIYVRSQPRGCCGESDGNQGY